MKTISGKPRFDSIYLGEVSLNLLSFPDVHMTATAGYIDSKTGKRFGSTQFSNGWSPATLLKLNELLDEMEQDIAAMVFDGDSATIRGGGEPAQPTSGGVPEL